MRVPDLAGATAPDPAPLWMPDADDVIAKRASPRPPDRVEGFSWVSRLASMLAGSRRQAVTTTAAVLAMAALPSVLPLVADIEWHEVLTIARYQWWTLLILLVTSWRVRTLSLAATAAYWLIGVFSTVLLVRIVGPVFEHTTGGAWMLPVFEEIAKALPLLIAVAIGRRSWRHPGLSDLLIMGFAVGSGYAFHHDVLWERVGASGFGLDVSVLVPSMSRSDTAFVVGHGVWTALVGLAIGLVVLHRRRPLCAALAGLLLLLVVGDRVSHGDGAALFGWPGNPTFGGRALSVLFLGGVVLAQVLDRHRLRLTAARDHLFPDDRRLVVEDATRRPDLFATIQAGRYRRLRNGMHTTTVADGMHWPPRSHRRPAPVDELARLGRAAGFALGAGARPTGWEPESGTAALRFVGPFGFTSYVVVDGEPALAAPPGRADAVAVLESRGRRLTRLAGRVLAAAALLGGLALVIAVQADRTFDPAATSLFDAPNSPALVPLIVGGFYALIAAQTGLPSTPARRSPSHPTTPPPADTLSVAAAATGVS